MRSSLKMVLSEPNNLPAIKVKIVKTDEDELVGQVFEIFNDQFGFNSEWCSVTRDPHLADEKTFLIRPIPDNELKNEHGRIGRKLMEIGELPLPEKAKYFHAEGNFLYEMFPDGKVKISTKSKSVKTSDAADVLLDVIVHLCGLISKANVSEKDRVELDKKIDRVIHSLPIYLGKSNPYEDLISIPYIKGRMTALEWFKSIPQIKANWRWQVDNDNVKVNGVQVTSKDLDTKMMDISTNDPALFNLDGNKDIVLEVGELKYLLTFNKISDPRLEKSN